MLVTLALFCYLTSMLCGSHLLGAFVAGMCFVGVGRSRQVWRVQLKRIRAWCVRIFYAATVGFAVPITAMASGHVIGRGLLLGLCGGILSKLLSTLVVRYMQGKSLSAERLAAKRASLVTRSGHVEPAQLVVGAAMVARGEFSFLIADEARRTIYAPAGELFRNTMSNDVYAVVMWALLFSVLCQPLLMRWSIAVFKRGRHHFRMTSTAPGTAGGAGAAGSETSFVMNIVGKHFPGLVTEIANSLRVSGVDVFEARITCDGLTEIAKLIVRPRGKTEDFDDEHIDQMRGAIEQLTGDKGTVVYFEQEQETHETDSVIEVQAVGEINRRGAARVITAILTEFGLHVVQGQGVTSIQTVRGFQRRIGTGAWYAINRDVKKPITEGRARRVRELLAAATSTPELKAWLSCSFMVKRIPSVACPPKPFTDFVARSPHIAARHAKKERWEIPIEQLPDAEMTSLAPVRPAPAKSGDPGGSGSLRCSSLVGSSSFCRRGNAEGTLSVSGDNGAPNFVADSPTVSDAPTPHVASSSTSNGLLAASTTCPDRGLSLDDKLRAATALSGSHKASFDTEIKSSSQEANAAPCAFSPSAAIAAVSDALRAPFNGPPAEPPKGPKREVRARRNSFSIRSSTAAAAISIANRRSSKSYPRTLGPNSEQPVRPMPTTQDILRDVNLHGLDVTSFAQRILTENALENDSNKWKNARRRSVLQRINTCTSLDAIMHRPQRTSDRLSEGNLPSISADHVPGGLTAARNARGTRIQSGPSPATLDARLLVGARDVRERRVRSLTDSSERSSTPTAAPRSVGSSPAAQSVLGLNMMQRRGSRQQGAESNPTGGSLRAGRFQRDRRLSSSESISSFASFSASGGSKGPLSSLVARLGGLALDRSSHGARDAEGEGAYAASRVSSDCEATGAPASGLLAWLGMGSAEQAGKAAEDDRLRRDGKHRPRYAEAFERPLDA